MCDNYMTGVMLSSKSKKRKETQKIKLNKSKIK